MVAPNCINFLIYKFSSTIISKWIKIIIRLKLNYTCCISKWIKIPSTLFLKSKIPYKKKKKKNIKDPAVVGSLNAKY